MQARREEQPCKGVRPGPSVNVQPGLLRACVSGTVSSVGLALRREWEQVSLFAQQVVTKGRHLLCELSTSHLVFPSPFNLST